MIIYFYTLLPLLFLPIDSSSIRGVNYKNDLVPSVESRSDPVQKDDNSLKIVSNEPFIIQLDVPNSGENGKKGSKEKDTKNKWPTKKSVTKIKSLRRKHRQRRDLELSKIDSDSSSMENTRNGTENSIDRMEILKVLKSHSKKRSRRRKKNDNKNHDSEKRNETSKNDTEPIKESSLQKLLPPEKAPIVKMVYPSTPKTDKRPHRYTLKELMADRERLEKKIKYIRNMLNTSNTDDLIRVRRKSESDRTANKIAKMFLTLSAVNGLHDRLKSKYDDSEEDDYEDNYRVKDIWEKEREENPSRRSTSTNEERYKVKKWIELLKNKRSSSKTCPCYSKDYEEDGEMFPLEQKLQKNYYFSQRGGSSEESSEGYRDHPKFSREKSFRNHYYSRRNHRGRDDNENKLKTLSSRGIKKLDLPLDDLEMYRSKAKQILQNAEEILDRIKEEEERRLATPNILMSRLKELTSKIQSDPRNNENDLIRKLQKNLGCGAAGKSSDGNSFVENMKSLILGPYEKAKALTDENSKKLSSYLLRNLGALDESDEVKDDEEKKEDSNIFFEQVQQKSDDKPFSASLAIENPEAVQKIKDETNQDEQFKKRMQEMIKEQEKILNMYEVPPESEENSHEFPNRAEHKKHKLPKDKNVESTLKGTKKPELDRKKDETIRQPKEKKTEKFNKHKQKESDSGKTDENDEKASKTILENLKKNSDENEKNIESDIRPESIKLKSSLGDKMKVDNLKKEFTSENPEDEKKVEEVVAATEDETNSRHVIGAEPESRFDPSNFGSLHYLTEDYDDYPRKTYEKSESSEEENLQETKPNEETISETREKLETDSDRNSELDKSETVKSSQKNSDFNPDQEETIDEKESGEKVEEKMLKMKTLDETNKSEKADDEDWDDERIQMSHPVLDNDVDNLKSSRINAENSKEDYNAGEKEVSSKDQIRKDLLENSNPQKEQEFEEETLGREKDDLEYGEPSKKLEKQLEKSSEMREKPDEETGNILKATKNSESGEEMDKNAEDKTLEMTDNSQEINKKTENSEGSNETILKSTANQSSEESDKDFGETFQSSEEPVRSEKKITETQKNNEEDDDKFLQKSKSDRGDSEIENLENLRENDSSEQTSEERNMENLKAVGPENQSEQDTQQTNSDEEIKESEIEYEEKILKAPKMEEAENLKNESEERSNEDDAMNVEESFKKEEDEENALGVAKSSEEKLKNEEDDKSERVKAISNDENDENEEKNFLKEENVKDAKDEEKAEDVSSAFNKDDSELEETEDAIIKSENRNRDSSIEKAEENENVSDESSLRATINKNEEGQESDEMSLKSMKANEDDNEEAEDENDATLKAVGMEDDEEVSVGEPKPDEVEEKENRSDDKGIEDEDVRAINVGEDIQEVEENENQSLIEDPKLKATANENEEDEMNIGATNENINKEAEEKENTSEGEDSTLRENLNADKESLEETPLRAINVGEDKNEEADEKENKNDPNLKSNLNEENSEETSLRATNMNQDGGSVEAEDTNNTSEEKDPTVRMKQTAENSNEETPLRATNVDEEKSQESESEEIKTDSILKSNLNSDEETLENSLETNKKTISNESKNQKETMEDETTLKSVKDIIKKIEETETGSDENSLERTMNERIFPKENTNDQFSLEESGESGLRAENLEGDNLREEKPKEVNYFENNDAFRRESAEEFSNNIDDDDETPLRSAMMENDRIYNEESEESSRVSSFTDNEIENENDDEISLKSANPFEYQPKSDENENSLEMENQMMTTEGDSGVGVPEPTYQTNSQKMPSDNLRESHQKKKSLKVPSSIAQIMKDLEGQEKGDVSSIENLSPEKIDHIIDKIDEVEQQNKAIDEVDCRKQCACAEDINTRSRNIGRYEIVKDFLHWMKDLKMNRVLSDD